MGTPERPEIDTKAPDDHPRLDDEDEIDFNDPNLGSFQWLEDWEEDQKGPPEDPRAAAYYPTVRLIDRIFELEAKCKSPEDPDPRLLAILEDFHGRRRAIMAAAARGRTLAEQFDSMQETAKIALYSPLVVKPRRPSKGPSNAGLLSEYRSILPLVSEARRLRRSHGHKAAAERLRIDFPVMSEDQATEAMFYMPSIAAHHVLGARHGLSPETIRKRVRAARQALKDWQANHLAEDESATDENR